MWMVTQGVILAKFAIKEFSSRLDYAEQLIAKEQIIEVKRLEVITE